MFPALRPLSFGEILDGSFAVYRRHFVVLYATALLPALPLAALGGAAAFGLTRAGASGGWLLLLGLLLVGPGAALAAWGALQRQVSSAILGLPVTLADGFAAGLRAAPALWVQGLVLLVAWFFFTLLSGLGVGAGAMGVGVLGLPGAILALLIWIGGFGSGQLAFFALTFAAPAAVVLEGRGPLASLARGMELGRGALPRAMALIGVCLLIMLLPMLALGAVGGMLAPAEAPSVARIAVLQAANLLIGSLTVPFLAATLTLLYYDRLVREEALDVRLLAERLAAV